MAFHNLRDDRGRFIRGTDAVTTKRRPRNFRNSASNVVSPTRKRKNQRPMTSDTRIIFILDSSGSMQSCRAATISGFNEFVQSQKQTDPYTTMDLITFGSMATTQFSGRRITGVDPLTTATYRADQGLTALYDAVGDAIDFIPRPNERVLVVIMTDGEENHSRKWTHYTLRRLIENKQSQGNWTFVFMGSNQDAWITAGGLGMHRGNTMTYNATPAGTKSALMAATIGTQSYTQSSAPSTTTFFHTTDLAKLSPAALNTLEDFTQAAITRTVVAECRIDEFVEKVVGRTYLPGQTYYQLTKPEYVQSYKNILIREKGKKAIRGGYLTRDVLGIPAGNVKITPGNHSKWDIFIQSNSVNRKLVRGTTVIVLK